ncbi:MAG: hypothetical protein ACPGYL_15630, partial [Rhodospirillaceae bacterium]
MPVSHLSLFGLGATLSLAAMALPVLAHDVNYSRTDFAGMWTTCENYCLADDGSCFHLDGYEESNQQDFDFYTSTGYNYFISLESPDEEQVIDTYKYAIDGETVYFSSELYSTEAKVVKLTTNGMTLFYDDDPDIPEDDYAASLCKDRPETPEVYQVFDFMMNFVEVRRAATEELPEQIFWSVKQNSQAAERDLPPGIAYWIESDELPFIIIP